MPDAGGSEGNITPREYMSQEHTPEPIDHLAYTGLQTNMERHIQAYNERSPHTPEYDREGDGPDPLADPEGLYMEARLSGTKSPSPTPETGAEEVRDCSQGTLNSAAKMDVDPEFKVTRSPGNDQTPSSQYTQDQCQVQSIDQNPNSVNPPGNERQGVASCDMNLTTPEITPAMPHEGRSLLHI